MSESIVVVVSVLVVYGLFGLMAHKAEQIVKAQKLEERKTATGPIPGKAGGK